MTIIAPLLLAAALLCPAGQAGAADKGFFPLADTPAYELLEGLELLEVKPSPALAVEPPDRRKDGSYTVRITPASPPPANPFDARGAAILQTELINTKLGALRSIDLLYNKAGRLLAAFPVLPEGYPAAERPRYFDFSPFYARVPRMDDPARAGDWRAFAPVYARDRALVLAFARERFGKEAAASHSAAVGGQLPYRLHEVNAKTGEWSVSEFSPLVFLQKPPEGELTADQAPEDFLESFNSARRGYRRTVIPTFPTVYALANLTPDETNYLRYLTSRFDLRPGARILVVGPGTGVDTWIASYRSTAPVTVIGINPLEVANTRAAARIAGFGLRAFVGDNVADERGVPRLAGERFDAVFWSMPAVWEQGFPEGHSPSLSDLWDGDIGASVLKRLARALPLILEPQGISLLWNYAPQAEGRNLVEDILSTAGGDSKVFDVEVEKFVKRRKPKEEYFLGCLYTLRRPAAAKAP